MNTRFSNEVIAHIKGQSIIYTCACPAQICKVINESRALFTYQQQCLNLTDTDKAVHQAIAKTAESIHVLLEQCLEDILQLEGWDMETYQLPESMLKKLMSEFSEEMGDGKDSCDFGQ